MLEENVHYYIENGYKVFTEFYHLTRGWCCKNNCRHCPYKTKKMANQFFYTRKELISGTPENPEFREFKDSFNVNKVTRTISIEDGRVLVLLDDIHERSREIEDVDFKSGRVKGIKRQRDTFQTEIYLDPADGVRFMNLTTLG